MALETPALHEPVHTASPGAILGWDDAGLYLWWPFSKGPAAQMGGFVLRLSSGSADADGHS